MMMRVLLIAFFLTASTSVFAQSSPCKCYEGMGSSEETVLSLAATFDNGMSVSVCGGSGERLTESSNIIAEFSVFRCDSGRSLVAYDGMQYCYVSFHNDSLLIEEFKTLPGGKDWTLIDVKLGSQKIYIANNQITVSDQEPVFKPFEMDSEQTDAFLSELHQLQRKGLPENAEEIISRLEILSLNGEKKAMYILKSFERYFKCDTDGALAEQWKDALATLEWVVW